MNLEPSHTDLNGSVDVFGSEFVIRCFDASRFM